MSKPTPFSTYVRGQREAKQANDPEFSLRKVAARIHLKGRKGVEPSYVSKVECGAVPPSDDLIVALAEVLGENPNVLFLLAKRVPEALVKAVQKRPHLFAQVLDAIQGMPDHAILRIVREVRDGKW